MIHFKSLVQQCFGMPRKSRTKSRDQGQLSFRPDASINKRISARISDELSVKRWVLDSGKSAVEPGGRGYVRSKTQLVTPEALAEHLDSDKLDSRTRQELFEQLKQICITGNAKQRCFAERVIDKCIIAYKKSPNAKNGKACLDYFKSVANRMLTEVKNEPRLLRDRSYRMECLLRMSEEELAFLLTYQKKLRNSLRKIYGADAILRATGDLAPTRAAWELYARREVDAHRLYFEAAQCLAGRRMIPRGQSYNRKTFRNFLMNLHAKDAPERLVGWIAYIEHALLSGHPRKQIRGARFLAKLLEHPTTAPAVKRVLDLRFAAVREECNEAKKPIVSRWPPLFLRYSLKRHFQYGVNAMDGLVKDIKSKGQRSDKVYMNTFLHHVRPQKAFASNFGFREVQE